MVHKIVNKILYNFDELDEIGEHLNTHFEIIPQTKWNNVTRRKLVEEKFGKNVASKYSDNQLKKAWFKYQPQ